jgi:hypothetical protein
MVRLLIALALCAAPVFAEVKVGEAAPKFVAKGDIVNRPEALTLEDCKGDVILIKEWQARDIESMREMPTVQKIWAERGGKGLHAFLIHRLDFEKYYDVMEICEDRGYTFPVPMGGFYDKSDFGEYKAETKGSFRTTVIGIDGKVAFYGKSGWQEVLEAELKKCVYPGLTKQTVAKACEVAAAHFMKRSYGRALNEAQKLKDSPDEAVKADAALIMARAEHFARALSARIDKAKEDRRWLEAIALCERMEDEFINTDYAKNAAAQIKAIKDDKSLKSELKAWENYKRTQEGNKKQKDRAMKVNALRAFAKAHPGTKAAEDAEMLAKGMADSLKKD